MNDAARDDAYKYNGKEWDETMGLYDYGARWYDPVVGRWGQVDPLGEHPNQVDKSPYAYAWNNPVLLDDPDGRCPRCAVSLGRIGIRALRYHRSLGGGTFREILSAEGRSIAGDARTLVGKGVRLGSRIKAFVDLAVGTDFNKTTPDASVEVDEKQIEGRFLANDVSTIEDESVLSDFDQAREEAFDKAGFKEDEPEFSKYDEQTGTVTEFKGKGGKKVGYDGPHDSPGKHHDKQHISWQSEGKRGQGGTKRDNIPYKGPRHPSRSEKKE